MMRGTARAGRTSLPRCAAPLPLDLLESAAAAHRGAGRAAGGPNGERPDHLADDGHERPRLHAKRAALEPPEQRRRDLDELQRLREQCPHLRPCHGDGPLRGLRQLQRQGLRHDRHRHRLRRVDEQQRRHRRLLAGRALPRHPLRHPRPAGHLRDSASASASQHRRRRGHGPAVHRGHRGRLPRRPAIGRHPAVAPVHRLRPGRQRRLEPADRAQRRAHRACPAHGHHDWRGRRAAQAELDAGERPEHAGLQRLHHPLPGHETDTTDAAANVSERRGRARGAGLRRRRIPRRRPRRRRSADRDPDRRRQLPLPDRRRSEHLADDHVSEHDPHERRHRHPRLWAPSRRPRRSTTTRTPRSRARAPRPTTRASKRSSRAPRRRPRKPAQLDTSAQVGGGTQTSATVKGLEETTTRTRLPLPPSTT